MDRASERLQGKKGSVIWGHIYERGFGMPAREERYGLWNICKREGGTVIRDRKCGKDVETPGMGREVLL